VLEIPLEGPRILTALEAGLVEFVASGNALLGGIDRLSARGALGGFNGNERHFDLCACVCLRRGQKTLIIANCSGGSCKSARLNNIYVYM